MNKEGSNSRLENINIDAPENSVNTDKIHIAKLNGLNITNSKIRTGDDCISFGKRSMNIYIERVSCGPGHGFNIGSLGKFPNEEPLEGMFLKNFTVTEAVNGVRFKSWPNSHLGIVRDIRFEDIIINNEKDPMIIDGEYSLKKHTRYKGAPSKVKFTNVSFRRIRGTSSSKVAVKLICSADIPCENVEVANINFRFNEEPANSRCTNAKTKVTRQNVLGGCVA
ncbi:polygalacturonase-like [Bidens hawaiensis]|uniref:polygalacturonase-like n=1 Tax=Bidens hawaiensis TaxID=980011 RepID=UPI00404A58B0